MPRSGWRRCWPWPTSRRRTEAAPVLAAPCAAAWFAADRWLPDAATAAAARNDVAFLKAIAAAAERPARPARRCSRSSSAWPSTGRAAGRPTRSGGLLASPPRRRAGGQRGRSAGPGPRLAQGPRRALDRSSRRGGAQAARDRAARRRRGQLVRLVGPWGNQALDRISAEIAASLRGRPRETSRSPNRGGSTPPGSSSSCEAQRRSRAASNCSSLITPRTSPELAAGLIEAVAASKAPEVGQGPGRAAARASPPRARPGPPGPARPRRLEPGPGRRPSSRTRPSVSELALDQKQALAAHPNREIAAARRRAARARGRPARPRPPEGDRPARAAGQGRGRRRAGQARLPAAMCASATATAAKAARSAPTSPAWPPCPATSC